MLCSPSASDERKKGIFWKSWTKQIDPANWKLAVAPRGVSRDICPHQITIRYSRHLFALSSRGRFSSDWLCKWAAVIDSRLGLAIRRIFLFLFFVNAWPCRHFFYHHLYNFHTPHHLHRSDYAGNVHNSSRLELQQAQLWPETEWESSKRLLWNGWGTASHVMFFLLLIISFYSWSCREMWNITSNLLIRHIGW